MGIVYSEPKNYVDFNNMSHEDILTEILIPNDLHEQWRDTKRLPEGGFQQRLMETTDPLWDKQGGHCDIANTKFIDLPRDIMEDNVRSAKMAHSILWERLSSGKPVDDRFVNGEGAKKLHIRWRHSHPNHPLAKVKFEKLQAIDKKKNADILISALAFFLPILFAGGTMGNYDRRTKVFFPLLIGHGIVRSQIFNPQAKPGSWDSRIEEAAKIVSDLVLYVYANPNQPDNQVSSFTLAEIAVSSIFEKQKTIVLVDKEGGLLTKHALSALNQTLTLLQVHNAVPPVFDKFTEGAVFTASKLRKLNPLIKVSGL